MRRSMVSVRNNYEPEKSMGFYRVEELTVVPSLICSISVLCDILLLGCFLLDGIPTDYII